MGRVDGKVALVTGAASGIGAACAEALAGEGAAVVLCDVQDEMGRAQAERIAAAGGGADYLRLDVTQEADWERAMAEAGRLHGRLDILVNNAGVSIGCPSITDMSLADWRRQLAVNLDGVFLGLKHGLRLMRASGAGGSVINMSSTAGLRGTPGLAAYSASKGGVRLLTKSVALECAAARDGIRVNSVHPGMIETPIWNTFANPAAGEGPPNLDALAAARAPIGVKGLPVDIAQAVLWLASEESRYVTGAELVVDGGLTAR
jgi:NAD(P)-dependent dehydrogenase (short-subunit alcohol dehydrogenase family)